MLKIIWLSDLHYCASNPVIGHDSAARIAAAVTYINHHHSDAAFCIITGDMVNHGSQADYTELKHHLDTLSIPYFPMAGNHDNRSLIRTLFPLPDLTLSGDTMPDNLMDEFFQYAIPSPAGLFLCLDTQKAGCDEGEYCAQRMDWLVNQLTHATDTPVYLFMHHPPMDLGLPMQDKDKMQDGQNFLDTIEKFSSIKHLFIGHVHRPICGTTRGIPFATMRSVLYQAPAPWPAWDFSDFTPAREAPDLGVLTIDGANITLQYTQFCDYAVGT